MDSALAAAAAASARSARTLFARSHPLIADYLYGPTVGVLVVLGYAACVEAGVTLSLSVWSVVGAVAVVGVCALGAVTLWAARATVLYSCVVAFNRVVVNLYFRNVHVAGPPDAVPLTGPVLLIGNHQNQFMDGLLLTALSPRPVRLITAAKSLDRPLVGAFARGLGCIPVTRPKDVAFSGAGAAHLLLPPDGAPPRLVGVGSAFADELHVGATVDGASGWSATVVRVVDAGDAVVDKVRGCPGVGPEAYVVVPKLDHSDMFGAVFDELADGAVVGLFPEGGSHDQTHLLPLKAGVALMALGAVEQQPGLKVTIVPVGFTYHAGHRFRSTCVVNYGAGVVVDDTWVAWAQHNRRAAVSELLAETEAALRSVTVNVPDDAFLDFVLTTKRLYTPAEKKLSAAENLLLTQRFAAGLQRDGVLDRPDVQAVRARVETYAALCRRHGYNPLSDTVVERRSLYGIRIIPLALAVLALALVAAIPGLVLNVPVGVVARWLANRHAADAVKNSSVKVHGRDVISSYKVIVGVVALPAWFLTLTLALLVCTSLRWSTVVLVAASMPLFSYLGVRFTEQGVIWSRKLFPLLLRILPSYRHEEEVLAALRSELVGHIRRLVEEVGPGVDDDDRIISRAELAGAGDFDGWIGDVGPGVAQQLGH